MRLGPTIIACLSVALTGLQGMTSEAFLSLAQREGNIARDAAQKKDYSKATDSLKKVIKAHGQLAEKDREQQRSVLATANYNLACYHSLAGQKTEALAALREAVKEGYKNYLHMKSDTDFDSIRETPEFKEILAGIREIGDYNYILKKAGGWDRGETATKPKFTFEDPTSDRLKKIAEQYDLKMVAGRGDDVSQILRLMRFVHLTANHDGSNSPNVPRNAIDLLNYAKTENRGINCRCMSITLNDVYLAAGFKSRYVTCMPKDPKDPDCHVIVSVYAPSLKKWLWMDPSFAGYFRDPEGNLLSIEEVRDRILTDKPLVPSSELNWNGTKYTGEAYINYMTKNLYWFHVPLGSESDYETDSRGKSFVALMPTDFQPEKARGQVHKINSVDTIITSDPAYFWQLP